LSPNAEKAWHQNSGANRRVVIKDVDMALLSLVPGSACWRPILAGLAIVGDFDSPTGYGPKRFGSDTGRYRFIH
jgi:hypothetical protein